MILSVFFTAERIQQYLPTTESVDGVVPLLKRAGVSKVYLEARRGGVSTPENVLAGLRDRFQSKGFATSGGIMTIRMNGEFGVAASGPEGRCSFLCYSTQSTCEVLETEIRKLARVFDEIIIDDAFLTTCRCPKCRNAKGDLEWGEFRRQLMLSVSRNHIVEPAHEENADCRVIIKFPQYYDRYAVFGYDPGSQTELFDGIWAGTETRDPSTLAYGYVPQYEGFVHYRWLQDIGREKLQGAWFDFIECTPELFIDQAITTTLAGTEEITLYCHGPEIFSEESPLLPALEAALPDLKHLASLPKKTDGVGLYMPVDGEGDGDLFIGDFLGMWAIPLRPCNSFPEDCRAIILPSRAGGDPDIAAKAERALGQGATVLLTTAFLCSLSAESPLFDMAGLENGGVFPVPSEASGLLAGEKREEVKPFHLACDLRSVQAEVLLTGLVQRPIGGEAHVPILTRREHGNGKVLVLNLGTFSRGDYRLEEFLNIPVVTPMADPPQTLLSEVRRHLLAPLGVETDAPYGVALYPTGDGFVLVNYGDEDCEFSFNSAPIQLAAHSWREIHDSIL
ncbi:MAG: hypothetical protein ABIH23_24245 [bacterium]